MDRERRKLQVVEARAAHGRVPPCDLDTEAAVLSACLLSAEALDEVADVAQAEHCYSASNRIILAAILELHAASKPVDVVTVADVLRAAGDIERVGGVRYLAQITDATPAVVHARAHALRMRELWQARRLIATCQVAVAEGYDAAGDVGSYLDRTGASVFESLEQHGQEHTCTLSEALTVLWQERAQEAEGGGTAIPTGLCDLDARLRAKPGDLIVIGARPGMGKSALAHGWAAHAAAHGHTSLLFSLEMPRQQVAARLQAQASGVDLARMLAWRLSETEQQEVTSAAARISQLPLRLDDRASCTVVDVRSVARRVAREAERAGAPLKLVVVDYIQLMSGLGDKREEQIASLSRGLKVAARELGVVVVALSQLNRGVESRQDKRPCLADLRESGAIEQDADAVLMLYRDDYYDPESKDAGIAELAIAKQRNGPTGVVRARWLEGCTRFEGLAWGAA